jgi:precorrin-6B methylase 2
MLTVDFDRLNIGPDTKVIDVGCGAGRHSFEAYRRGADIIAFDQDITELADV